MLSSDHEVSGPNLEWVPSAVIFVGRLLKLNRNFQQFSRLYCNSNPFVMLDVLAYMFRKLQSYFDNNFYSVYFTAES